MKLFFVAADFGGCSWYRIIQPAGLSAELYETSHWSLAERLNQKLMYEADMVVVQRQGSEIAMNTTRRLLQNGTIMVSEIDDNLWSVPPDIAYVKKEWHPVALRLLEKHFSICHAVTVSTPKLAKLVKPFNPNVFILPNLVVFDPAFQKQEFGKIRIGWSGSDTHLGDFTPDIQQALLDIKEKYRDDVDICLMGCVPDRMHFKTSFHHFIQPHLYLPKFRALGLDIGIIPARDNAFNECRSNLKFVEYSSSRMVTIASNIEPYRNSIIHGRTGLLISKNNRKNWFNMLRDLIEDEKSRREMADRAYDYCYENYSVQNKKQQYSIYYEIMNKIQGG